MTLELETPPPSVAAAPPAPKKMPGFRIVYTGMTGALYGLWLKKIFLSLFTLGIYSFWGKTAIRRYIVSATSVRNDPFEYHGTGKELFIGFLKIMPFYFVFMAVLVGVQMKFGQEAGSLVVWPVILYLFPVARYASMRYRVNRISWRGIRGRMGGSAFAYGGYHLKGMLIKIFTLGLSAPNVDMGRFACTPSGPVGHLRA